MAKLMNKHVILSGADLAAIDAKALAMAQTSGEKVGRSQALRAMLREWAQFQARLDGSAYDKTRKPA